MPRRERRSGGAYIPNDKERDVSFFKRRSGLFKSAADLSVVTGTRVVVILEANNGKMHSLGTRSTTPFVDAFLPGAPLIVPLGDEATITRIVFLQSEVSRLDMEYMVKDKRNQLSIHHMKQIQELYLGMVANLIFLKEEDLKLEDTNKLFNELSRVHEDIRRVMPPLHQGFKAMTAGASMP
ncbi:Agamous-like MADS-box protein AGL62 [Hordeum vulgare]|nr:Agamous-like MADS-box protein AGL62 [Hordeum vulgare]